MTQQTPRNFPHSASTFLEKERSIDDLFPTPPNNKIEAYERIGKMWEMLTVAERKRIFNVLSEAEQGWEEVSQQSIVEGTLCDLYGDHKPPYDPTRRRR